MTIICQPIDASAGAPTYTAQNSRQAFSSLMMNGTSRRLGGISGIRPGAGGETTISGSNVTVQPFSAIVDAAYTADQAPYQVASNAVEVRAINAAHATLPRVDLLYLQVSDAGIDPSGARTASLLYLAGTASGSPAKPALPARSIEWATVGVPASGGGAATVTRTVSYAVASGGVLPVANAGAYPATPYIGMHVFDLSLGYELVWTGAAWAGAVASLSAMMKNVFLAPGSNIDSPTNALITQWIPLGNVDVPVWATQAMVSWTLNGLFPLVVSLNVNATIRIGSAAGTLRRLLDIGSTSQRFNHSVHEKLTGLGSGVLGVEIATTRVAGSPSSSYRADVNSTISANIWFLP